MSLKINHCVGHRASVQLSHSLHMCESHISMYGCVSVASGQPRVQTTPSRVTAGSASPSRTQSATSSATVPTGPTKLAAVSSSSRDKCPRVLITPFLYRVIFVFTTPGFNRARHPSTITVFVWVHALPQTVECVPPWGTEWWVGRTLRRGSCPGRSV